MVTVSLAVLLVAVSTPGDAVLLDFTAPWCVPCRSMEPTMAQLAAGGLPVRKVNIDNERELAKQFGISSIPCFVLVKNGHELGRIVGPASAGELQRLFAKADSNDAPRGVENVRGQSPEEPLRRIAPNSAGHQRLLGDHTSMAARTIPVSDSAQDAGNPFRRAGAMSDSRDEFAATPAPTTGANDFIKYAARLKIEDKDGASYGTGTIIDTRGDQALILTCAHIFRESQGQGAVSVDLFVPGAPKKLAGRVVSYDLKRDVALVSVRPGVPVLAARVAPEGFRFQNGDRVITVGCNNGGEPTVEESRVTAVDKFVGPPNVQVAGQPVQGRSGGGLFTPDGVVVGVCNAADPTDNAGLFAAAGAIHEELDAARLSSIYRSTAKASQPLAADSPNRSIAAAPREDRVLPASATELRTSAAGAPDAIAVTATERAAIAGLQSRSDAEVICIVRPHGDMNAKSEVIVLDRASSAFLDKLDAERQTQQSRRLTSLDVRREDKWRHGTNR